MTQNRTSQAVTRWAIVSQLDTPIRCSRKNAAELLAIAEKFKRMEVVLPKALEKLRLYREQHSGEHIGGTEFHQLASELEAAIAFDPLSKP